MKHLLFLILLLSYIPVSGQNSSPGGVKGAVVWEVTEVMKNGQAEWRSRLNDLQDSLLTAKGNIQTINNNPALLFTSSANRTNSTLNLGKLESFSLFTVCQAHDTLKERVIISLENDSAAEMVLTDRRMAALDVYRYANYTSGIDLYPKIYSYTQNKSIGNDAAPRMLLFGSPPGNQRLPVAVYNGLIPEVVLFNRFISPVERRKVESYLALKYGISLNQEIPASYLNSRGEVIWDSELNEAFNKNIAGIGRDDLSGLNQRISESTQSPGVLKIGVSGELKDNCFLIWSDNGRPMEFFKEAGIRQLQREWRVTTFNYDADSLYFETNELSLREIDPLEEGEIYWLMIDESGTGKYPFGKVRFLPSIQHSSTPGFIRFSPVVPDTDHSGSDVFTLVAAPSFCTRCIVQSPACSSVRSGSIETEIAGGVPPFMISLSGLTNETYNVSARESGRYHLFTDVSQGDYILKVIDADNKVYTQEIWISNTHPWTTTINPYYKLIEGETLDLNASEGMPAADYYYSWITPEGSVIHSDEISINRPGNFFLSVTDVNNCSSTLAIRVDQTGKSVFRKAELFPNPISGRFLIRLSLERIADVNIVISDMSGNIIKQSALRNDKYYLYNDIIATPGLYLITLVSGIEKETLRLIVQ